MKIDLNKIYKCITNKNYRTTVLEKYGIYNNLEDEEFIKRIFEITFGYIPDLENPKTFNEKLNWLKLNNRKDIFTTMVDKYLVKEYVSKLIGSDYVVPLLGVWDKFSDIDFDLLPNQFVLKSNHGSGGICICRDKKTLDISSIKKKLLKDFNVNYYYHCREWPYKNIVPKIIAEKYLQNKDNPVLYVYKVMNFNGVPKVIQVIQNDKLPDETIDYFDTKWNLLDLKQNFPNSEHHLPKPTCLEKMLDLSEKCSQGFPFLRTDWYEVDGKVFFSEFTFYSDAGFAKFIPNEWDRKLGDLIDLSLVK